MVDDFDVTHVPQSRVEEQLENMDGGTNPRRVPQSRVEYLLDEMINGGAGLVPEGVQGQYVGYDSNGKGLAISPDTEPVGLSNKLITSGAVYAAIAAFPKGIVYRGAVDYYVQLPVNAKEGDAYTVRYTGQSGTEPDGTEYARGMLNGTLQWIAIGPDLTRIIGMINTKQDILTFDQAPADGSSNPVTSDGIYDALATKQDTLTFDNTPTENSDNPVTSDGIYDALATKQDTLTFDNTPTENSDNPVTSDGIYDALATKQDTLTFDSAPTDNSANPVTSGGVYSALENKQDNLTFDNVPTENSNNPVKSGGVYASVAAKADKVEEITVSTEGAVTQSLTAGKIYHFTGEEISTLTISLSSTTDLAQYHFDFNSNNTAVALVLPKTVNVKLNGGVVSGDNISYTMEANTHYEIDILNGYGVVADWEIPPIIQALLFSSPSTFTLATANSTKNWDGTLETSTDGSTWVTWDGTSGVSSSNDGKLYVRGSGNTVICANNSSKGWVLTGSDISCFGDIRYLLKYNDRKNATMGVGCFRGMFKDCTSLVTPPALPDTTIIMNCYYQMFYGCSNLVSIPTLLDTSLDFMKQDCYNRMFTGCSKIKVSTTQDSNYTIPYQTIPYGGDTSQTPASQILCCSDMFYQTGGTFTGTPSSNTMYYLHKDCSIVPAN